MIDAQTCKDLKLEWKRAVGAEFGTYSTPGHDYIPYAGVTAPCNIWFDDEIDQPCNELKVVDHPYRLLLIGADVLRAGRKGSKGWKWCSIGGIEDEEKGEVHGFLSFVKKEGGKMKEKTIRLACAPSGDEPRTIIKLNTT